MESAAVISGLDDNNEYQLKIEYGEDAVNVLDREQARAYAAECYVAAAQARYDAAVFAQATKKLNMPPEVAAGILQRLREQRRPLDATSLGILRLVPGVSVFTRQPYIQCMLTVNTMAWQWTLGDLESHADGVLQCQPTTELDTLYLRLLTETVGVDFQTGAQVVMGLASFLPGP